MGLEHLHTLTIPLRAGLALRDPVVADAWDEYRERHPPSPSFASHRHFRPLAAEIDMSAASSSPASVVLGNGVEQPVPLEPNLEAIQPRAVVSQMLRCLRRAKAGAGGGGGGGGGGNGGGSGSGSGSGSSSGSGSGGGSGGGSDSGSSGKGRRGGFRALRTVRCFFILALERSSLDVNEFLIDVVWREPQAAKRREGGRGDSCGEDEQGGVERLRLDDQDAASGGRLELLGSPVVAYGWGTGLWLGDIKSLASRAWF